jgi:hypothetical protein
MISEACATSSLKPFKFENAWLVEEEINQFVQQQWQKYSSMDITGKLDNCATELIELSKDNCYKTRKEIDNCRKNLKRPRSQVSSSNIDHFNSLRKRLDTLLVKDDLFWRQRAKTFWYKEGDLNTRFFHTATTSRKQFNKINSLVADNGDTCRDLDGMKTIAHNYFVDLFQKSAGGQEEVINAVPSMITLEDNEMLTCPFLIEEFREAIFYMQADKSPGPDGYNPGFYQHFWDLCSHDIFTAGCHWLNSGVFPPNLNSTNIVLIPKGESQTSMKDWRPITLCNVLYKITAKVLANRLKKVLNKRISDNQSAFVPESNLQFHQRQNLEKDKLLEQQIFISSRQGSTYKIVASVYSFLYHEHFPYSDICY